VRREIGMRVEHLGRQPLVDPSAWIAPNAVLSGPVKVGPNTRVCYGAVLTAECGAEVVDVRDFEIVAERQEGRGR
jgi:gamma-carbonic anhydrase